MPHIRDRRAAFNLPIPDDNLPAALNNPEPAEQSAPQQRLLRPRRSTVDLMRGMMRKASATNLRTSSTPFGPSSFEDQLVSDMYAEGCSKPLIAEFKKRLFPPGMQDQYKYQYVKEIVADLQANAYSSKSVQRHIDQMRNDSAGAKTFVDQLESNLREAGCSKRLIESFKKHYCTNIDPQSHYAQTIYADLEAHRFSRNRVLTYNKMAGRFNIFNIKINLNITESVRVDECRLIAVPSKLGKWTNLKRLSLQFNCLTALPPDLGQLTNLETLHLTKNHLTAVPPELGKLTNLTTLELNHNHLTTVPPDLGHLTNLVRLGLYNNHLSAVPPELGKLAKLTHLELACNRLTNLPDTLRNLRRLGRLNLNNNQFTHVPRVLLDLPVGAEIDLRDNPISPEEIAAVRQEMADRRAAGRALPTIIFPRAGEVINDENALQGAMEGGLNVHTHALTDTFKRQIDDLIQQFPSNLNGSVDEQRSEIRGIEQRLFDAFKRYPLASASDTTARQVATKMFAKAHGQQDAYYNDFQYSSGHILSYVFLSMEAQWERHPAEHRIEAQKNGVEQLGVFMAAGKDFCDTRHIEEIMQMISLPLSQYAQEHPEVAGKVAAVRPSPDQVRDATLPVAQRILRDLAQRHPQQTDDALRNALRTALTDTMRTEHPSITAEQLDAYIQTNILAHWEDFKEYALD